MNIGDLFYVFRGEGSQLQADAKAQGAKAGATLGQSIQSSIKKSFTGANIGKGLVQGLGLAGGLGIASVVSKVTGLVGESIDAFREDQVSVQKLGTALRDNVKDWDGNTDAIERTIKARTDLGFSDDDQRAGLATLVTVTHDATKALELEAGAMDIARARNVDLATASDAVAKAYGGNTKSLKSLIPGLNLGKSSAQALANAFGAVGGAASDFAKTDLGKVQVEEAKVNEAMEKLGSVLSGPVADGATAAADGLTAVFDALETLQGAKGQDSGIGAAIAAEIASNNVAGLRIAQAALQDATDKFKHPELIFAPATWNELMGHLADVNKALDESDRHLDHFQSSVSVTADTSAADMETMRGAMSDDLRGVGKALDDSGDDARDWRDKFKDAAGAAIRSAAKVRDAFVADAKAMIDGYYDPLEVRAALHDTREQLIADRETLRTAKTKEERRQARDAIVQDLDDEASALTDLASTGDLTAADVKKFAADARSQYGSMSKSAIADTEAIIRKLEELAGLHPKVNVNVDVKMSPADKALLQKITHHAAGHGPLEFGASGGRFAAGTNLITGEDGWEMMRLLPGGGAQVMSHTRSVAAVQSAVPSAGGGGDIHVNLLDRMPARSVQDIGDGLRMLERRGYLRRERR